MSVIEDTRKLLQDFLAPELRELSARVDALEERMDARFDGFEKSVDARFDSADRLASERHAQSPSQNPVVAQFEFGISGNVGSINECRPALG